jgi:hypothetical protein
MPTVHGIQFDELGRLGVDETGRLYWDNKPVVTEERITLAWWVNAAVTVGGVSTFVLALLAVLKFCGYGG